MLEAACQAEHSFRRGLHTSEWCHRTWLNNHSSCSLFLRVLLYVFVRLCSCNNSEFVLSTNTLDPAAGLLDLSVEMNRGSLHQARLHGVCLHGGCLHSGSLLACGLLAWS